MPETRFHDSYDWVTKQMTRTPYEVSDDQVEDDAGPELLRQSIARMRLMLTQLEAIEAAARPIAVQGANVGQVQIKGLFGAVADMAQMMQAQTRALRVLIKDSKHTAVEG